MQVLTCVLPDCGLRMGKFFKNVLRFYYYKYI